MTPWWCLTPKLGVVLRVPHGAPTQTGGDPIAPVPSLGPTPWVPYGAPSQPGGRPYGHPVLSDPKQEGDPTGTRPQTRGDPTAPFMLPNPKAGDDSRVPHGAPLPRHPGPTAPGGLGTPPVAFWDPPIAFWDPPVAFWDPPRCILGPPPSFRAPPCALTLQPRVPLRLPALPLLQGAASHCLSMGGGGKGGMHPKHSNSPKPAAPTGGGGGPERGTGLNSKRGGDPKPQKPQTPNLWCDAALLPLLRIPQPPRCPPHGVGRPYSTMGRPYSPMGRPQGRGMGQMGGEGEHRGCSSSRAAQRGSAAPSSDATLSSNTAPHSSAATAMQHHRQHSAQLQRSSRWHQLCSTASP